MSPNKNADTLLLHITDLIGAGEQFKLHYHLKILPSCFLVGEVRNLREAEPGSWTCIKVHIEALVVDFDSQINRSTYLEPKSKFHNPIY